MAEIEIDEALREVPPNPFHSKNTIEIYLSSALATEISVVVLNRQDCRRGMFGPERQCHTTIHRRTDGDGLGAAR